MLDFPFLGPSHNIRIVKIVMLLSVSVKAPDPQKHFQSNDCRQIVMGHPIIIPVKNTGITAFPQQDHCVGLGLEPFLHPGFQRLPRLCVMVIHKGYRFIWKGCNKRIFQQAAHIKSLPLAGGLMKLKVQRHIKE
ncbi:hypothetical protein SDC9_202467 [bioreactor metagenome]|uniref:Uncharacterized protein n=1 Tax=bioreactor metagenome TaxID=1076179 RepID=A0A645IV84_9ZZZZ